MIANIRKQNIVLFISLISAHDTLVIYNSCFPFQGDKEHRPKEEGLKSLRTTRTLQQGMVLTIEPGIYFIEQVPGVSNK